MRAFQNLISGATKRRCVLTKFSVGLTLLVAACSSSSTSLNPSTQLSTDPVLASVINSFEQGCIVNAPAFDAGRVRAGFDANKPDLAPGMLFLASGTPGKSCGTTVRRYGKERPAPSVGDINRLARIVANRTGWALTPVVPGKSSFAKVGQGRKGYSVGGYVTGDGDLRLTIYE